MKVVKKTAVKAKSPAKQYIDPNAKKNEQERQSRMTEEEKIRERKEKGTRVSTLERKEGSMRREKKEDPKKPENNRLKIQVEKEQAEREAKRKAEREKGKKGEGKAGGHKGGNPAGPMQLKSSAKTAPTKMKKC